MKKYNIKVVAMTIGAFVSISSLAKAGDSPSPAVYSEAESSSFYLSGFGGWNWADDFSARGSGLNLEADLDTGYVLGGALGFEMPVMGGLRFEVEGTYRSNDVDSVKTNGIRSKANGDLSAWSIMFNAAKEMPLTDRLSLYAGGGIGIAGVDADFSYGAARVNEKDTVFAWQVFAGVAYEVMNNFELYTEYRFFRAEDPELRRSVGGFSQSLDGGSYENQGLLLGARIHF